MFLITTSSSKKAVKTLKTMQKVEELRQENWPKVELVRKLIQGFRQRTIPIIADELSINWECVWKNITKNLEMIKKCADMASKR